VVTANPSTSPGTSYPQQVAHCAIPAVCARFPADHAARPADQIAAEHARRRARPVVHRHPRQPPHRGVDSRLLSAAGSSAGTTSPPCHATLPLSSRTRFAPIRTRHSPTISPAARLTAEQPQQGMLDTTIVIVLRWIDPAQLPDQIAISAITLARTVHRPAPRCGATTSRTPTTSLPSTPAALRSRREPKANSTRRHPTPTQHPHPRPPHGRGHRRTPTATTTVRQHDDRSHSHRRAATPFTTNTDDLASLDTLTRSPP
jgi:hypothetical protein